MKKKHKRHREFVKDTKEFYRTSGAFVRKPKYIMAARRKKR